MENGGFVMVRRRRPALGRPSWWLLKSPAYTHRSFEPGVLSRSPRRGAPVFQETRFVLCSAFG